MPPLPRTAIVMKMFAAVIYERQVSFHDPVVYSRPKKSGFYVVVSVFFCNELDFGRFTRRFSARGYRVRLHVVTENGVGAV